MKNEEERLPLVRRKAGTHETSKKKRKKKKPSYCRKATFKVTISILEFATDAATFYTQFCIRDIANLLSRKRLFIFMFVHRAIWGVFVRRAFPFLFARIPAPIRITFIIIIVARTAKGLPTTERANTIKFYSINHTVKTASLFSSAGGTYVRYNVLGSGCSLQLEHNVIVDNVFNLKIKIIKIVSSQFCIFLFAAISRVSTSLLFPAESFSFAVTVPRSD